MKRTLSDNAYEYLENLIFSSKLKKGDKIYEQNIVDTLEISRTPVREAIRRLVADGLLDFTPGSYASVHTFSKKEQTDLGTVRVAVDCLAVELDIQNGSNRDFNRLRIIQANCQQAADDSDISARIRYDCDFHTELSVISDNKELLSIQLRLTKRSRLMQLQAYEDEGASFCDLTGHKDIINALMDRDVKASIQAVRAHLIHFYRQDDGSAVQQRQ